MIGTQTVALPLLLGTCLFFAGMIVPGAEAKNQPAPKPTSAQTGVPIPSEVVRVSAASGRYHWPNSRDDGKAKHGKYSTEGDAIRAGCRVDRS